jgi:hypothetical protein
MWCNAENSDVWKAGGKFFAVCGWTELDWAGLGWAGPNRAALSIPAPCHEPMNANSGALDSTAEIGYELQKL